MGYPELALLDFLFVITLGFYTLAALLQAVQGQLIRAGKNLGIGVLLAALEVSLLGSFVFGVSPAVLFQHYVKEGYLILPELVKEIYGWLGGGHA
jgi:hypothetical protein